MISEYLATMIPSLAYRISSKFSRPSIFSILAMILICSPRGESRSLRYSMSAALVVNESEMKSTPFSSPAWIMNSSSVYVNKVSQSPFKSGAFTFFGDRRHINPDSWESNISHF